MPTYVCYREDDRKYVLEHMDELVVKAANESGGYGILIGPHATQAERAVFAKKIQENPRNYVAQPTLSLSRVPTMVGESLEGRHVDLRPYILCGPQGYLGDAWRADPRRAPQRIIGGQFVAGWWQQRYVGCRRAWSTRRQALTTCAAVASPVRQPARRHRPLRQYNLKVCRSMLSRVAETIYWMSRQVERAENLARFFEVTHNLILEQPENMIDPWKPLIQATADNELFAERYGAANAESVTQFLAFDLRVSQLDGVVVAIGTRECEGDSRIDVLRSIRADQRVLPFCE